MNENQLCKLFWPLWMSKMLRKRNVVKNDKKENKAIAACYLFMDLTGLRPIIFAVLEFFMFDGQPRAKYQKCWIRGYFGLINDVIKT